ncbi:hypothetical protein TNCV_122431 [Trichonephila clavipes]|nr:hypothetical protein TNCV_122431 [Trichonephila clavipes]
MSSRWCGVVVWRGCQLKCRPRIYDHASITRSITKKASRVAEQCDVNIHSLGDGPRNFKPWSSDEDDASINSLHKADFQWCWGRTHDTPATSPLL